MQPPKLNQWIRLLIVISACSCASKKDAAQEHEHARGATDEVVWEEMDDFHLIMAETFHPYKDSANLEPVKSRAFELMTAADEWSSAQLPHKVDNREMRSKLGQLKAETATLAESVKSANDSIIGEQLNKVYDTFHEIQEAWYQQGSQNH
jgi:hypothetical protein